MDWKILNIEPTTDKKKIRQAYATEVKHYHPEEHPDEFRRLQQAYREALRYAEQNTEKSGRQIILGEESQDTLAGQENDRLKKVLQSEKRKEDTVPEIEKVKEEKSGEPKTERKQITIPIEPNWRVSGETIGLADKRRRMKELSEDFLRRCERLLENEIGSDELGSWSYIVGQEKYQPLYEQPRFWHDLACFIYQNEKELSGSIRWYFWLNAKKYLGLGEQLDFVYEVLSPGEDERLLYEQENLDTDRKNMFYGLMEEGEKSTAGKQQKRVIHKRERQKAKRRLKKQVWACLFIIIVALSLFVRVYLRSYQAEQREEMVQGIEDYHVDPEDVQEILDQMKNSDVQEILNQVEESETE